MFEECLPTWGFERRGLHDATSWLCASHLPQHVCKLQKSIYGLKQAPRAWFESFTTQLLNLGFQPPQQILPCSLTRDGSVIAFLLLYVDDIVLTGNNSSFLTQLIHNLSKVFELKDMGTLSYFLGLQIQRSHKGPHSHSNQVCYRSPHKA
jgi:hypothetical protein